MNDNHTLDFNHFKLHSDSTLKTFTKDELISYIKMVHNNWSGWDERLFNIMNVLQKYYELEKELGCPVDVLFKALKNNIYYVKDKKILKAKVMNIKSLCYGDILIEYDYGDVVFAKDYKKTWWLKEDKSE